ncbi:MAG: hypothetical protein WBM35_16830 [Candidatus Electrothrix sp.]
MTASGGINSIIIGDLTVEDYSPVGWGEARTPTTGAPKTLGFAPLTRNLPAFHLMLMAFCPPFGMVGNVFARA